MFVYQETVVEAVRCLLTGKDVRVVGPGGSGRSSILDAVVSGLEQLGNEAVVVRVPPVAVEQPGYVLSQLQLELGLAPGRGTLQERVDAVAAALRGKILALDDMHHADALSLRALGTALGASAGAGATLLCTELMGRHRDEELPPRWPEALLDVPPLGVGQATRLVSESLGGPVDPAVVVRILSESGGIARFLLAIAQSAREHGRLTLQDGAWRMVGPTLWHSDLVSVVDGYLAGLDGEVRAAVDFLARPGGCSLAEALEHFPEGVWERARQAGIVSLSELGGRYELQLRPPLLVKRIARDQLTVAEAARRIASGTPARAGAFSAFRKRDAKVMAQQFMEHRRRAAEAAFAAWQREKTLQNACRYLKGAIGEPSEAARVQEVFGTPQSGEADSPEGFEFTVRHAQWLRYVKHDAGAAEELLRRFAGKAPHRAASIAAAGAFMAVLGGDGINGSVPVDADPASSELAGLLHVVLSLLRGELGPAREFMANSGRYRGESAFLLAAALEPLLLFFDGDATAALDACREAREAALERYDGDTFFVLSFIAAVIFHYLDNSPSRRQMLEEALAVGRPRPLLAPLYGAALNHVAISAHYHARLSIRDSLLLESGQLAAEPGPFLGSGTDILAALSKHHDDPAALDAAIARSLRARRRKGYTLTAVHTGLVMLSLSAGPLAAEELGRAAEGMDIPAFNTAIGLAGRLWNSTPSEIRIWLEHRGTGQDAALLAALVAAKSRAALRDGDPELSRELGELAAGLVGGGSGVARLLPVSNPVPSLTPREVEISLLAGSLSNPDIAERLRLSPRTVENHIANALRKTGASDRSELNELVRRLAPLGI
ncbi:hypothetical protein BIU82_12365 [Arthrobacter sp. SW1]|uniref:helix-turn-helix domain-containing protein n=1 Tax=Arthrobacter sp. SW1 TaxID=1920889 RepID=UPI000877D84D|nr:helix-turn-helix transcriptional regulator [Arthrobacter sp. SW1]OFI36851.1 hypothetical protein BIU82_12365 [Arthrobacter sp. SW1]